jgi:hypothetical protein
MGSLLWMMLFAFGASLLATVTFWIVSFDRRPGSFWSNDWQPAPSGYPWYWWGGVVALLALVGVILEYGFWRVTTWAIGISLGLAVLGLILIFSPQIWSNLQETFSAPLTFGGAFVLMLIFSALRVF